jgi:hypothetical protein
MKSQNPDPESQAPNDRVIVMAVASGFAGWDVGAGIFT